MKKIISTSSPASIVTKTANTANIRTKIFTVAVPRGARYDVANYTMTPQGVQRGMHIIMDLRTAGNAKISPTTKIYVAVKSAAAEFEKFLRSLPFSIWYDLTTAQQRNQDYLSTLVGQTDLNLEGFSLLEGQELQIWAEGPDVIDWTKSTLEFAVEEVN